MLTRTDLLARGARATALGLGAGALLTVPAALAANGSLPDLDLALARLATGSELLASAFYTAAIESKRFGDDDLRSLQRARFNEDEHLTAVSQILSGAGHTPATADDFDFVFPAGTFRSRESIARLGVQLETAALGTYLGAVDAFASPDLKTTAARIAASEAQHLSVFSHIASGHAVGISFPAPLDYETASAALDPFLA